MFLKGHLWLRQERLDGIRDTRLVGSKSLSQVVSRAVIIYQWPSFLNQLPASTCLSF